MRPKRKRVFIAREIPDAELTTLIAEISELIKTHRTTTGGSLEDFAYEIGISRSTLVRAESGGDMVLSNFLRIIYGLNMEPEDFFKELKKKQK
ncbi:helix-turn-helix domain-containing protein [Chitinophaga sp. 30R24]|uniref:helix-turn-helix domain-containing protein n=1 Tax=Chitinophaga sp. 30R24 TaxID=3248838 RepID=UPI003B8FB772